MSMQRVAGRRPEVSPCKAGSLASRSRSPHFILDHEGLSHAHGLKPCICGVLAVLGTGTTKQVRVPPELGETFRKLRGHGEEAAAVGTACSVWGSPSLSSFSTLYTVVGKAAGRPTQVTAEHVTWGYTVVPVEGSL